MIAVAGVSCHPDHRFNHHTLVRNEVSDEENAEIDASGRASALKVLSQQSDNLMAEYAVSEVLSSHGFGYFKTRHFSCCILP